MLDGALVANGLDPEVWRLWIVRVPGRTLSCEISGMAELLMRAGTGKIQIDCLLIRDMVTGNGPSVSMTRAWLYFIAVGAS